MKLFLLPCAKNLICGNFYATERALDRIISVNGREYRTLEPSNTFSTWPGLSPLYTAFNSLPSGETLGLLKNLTRTRRERLPLPSHQRKSTMTTTCTETRPDRAEINRRNAQKSTGPRTPEGKNRSRFNAVKHGMTARTLVLPGEDPDALRERLDSWIGNLQPQNDVEQFLVEQAVQSSWKLDRADRAEVARLSHIIETLPVLEANRQQEEAAALGRRLFSDRKCRGRSSFRARSSKPCSRAASPRPPGPSTSSITPGPSSAASNPPGPGCQWMLDRWIELRAILDQGQAWPSTEKSRAIRLLGKPPLNLTAEEWENHCERRRANPHPEIDGYLAQAGPTVGRGTGAGPGGDDRGAAERRGPGDRAAGAADRRASPSRRGGCGPASGPPVVRHQHRGRAAASLPVLVQPVAVPQPRHPAQSPPIRPGSGAGFRGGWSVFGKPTGRSEGSARGNHRSAVRGPG